LPPTTTRLSLSSATALLLLRQNRWAKQYILR